MKDETVPSLIVTYKYIQLYYYAWCHKYDMCITRMLRSYWLVSLIDFSEGFDIITWLS
jgi:hypothetical protein